MSHKPPVETTCAEPGCAEDRQRDSSQGRFRSRFCPAHARAQRAARKSGQKPEAAQKPTPPIVHEPRAYTPREVLAAWREDRVLGELYVRYDGAQRRVFGLQVRDGVYWAVLDGFFDGIVVLDGGERLERLTAGSGEA